MFLKKTDMFWKGISKGSTFKDIFVESLVDNGEKMIWNDDTVDGSEILHQLRLVVYPMIYKVLYISSRAGFLNHQQYHLLLTPVPVNSSLRTVVFRPVATQVQHKNAHRTMPATKNPVDIRWISQAPLRKDYPVPMPKSCCNMLLLQCNLESFGKFSPFVEKQKAGESFRNHLWNFNLQPGSW